MTAHLKGLTRVCMFLPITKCLKVRKTDYIN